jgi:hypothetical protein
MGLKIGIFGTDSHISDAQSRMYTPDERTEELLNGYLDGYLSALEKQEIQALLDSDPLVRQHFESLKSLQSGLRQILQSPATHASQPSNARPRRSSKDLLQSVLTEAGQRAASDPVYANATWARAKEVTRANPSPASAQHAGLQNDNRWIWAMAGLAASLILVAGWLIQSRLGNDSDIASQGLIAQNKTQSDAAINTAQNIPAQSNTTVEPRDPGEATAVLTPDAKTAESNSIAMNLPIQSAPPRPDSEVTTNSPEVGSSTTSPTVANSKGTSSRGPISPSKESISALPNNSFVKPDSQPTAEQIAALESALKGSVNLSYLLVVDVSLQDNEDSREILDQILTRYDIPSAVDLNVEESTLKKLADSRLIASGKVVLPDAKPRATSADSENETKAGLMFVKARGERLDAAIIEIMQRVDAFPEFSMDMAFDAPAQALASELQFIQEAALPKNAPIAKSSIASMLSSRSNTENSANRFQAPQRRGLPLAPEKRLSGKGPNGLGAEMMNPISCAIFILREAK